MKVIIIFFFRMCSEWTIKDLKISPKKIVFSRSKHANFSLNCGPVLQKNAQTFNVKTTFKIFNVIFNS